MPRGSPRLRTPDNKVNQVGARVQQRRQQLRLTQDQLCARLSLATGSVWGPAWQDVSRIENGARIVSDLELVALSQALECGACWLLLGTQVEGEQRRVPAP